MAEASPTIDPAGLGRTADGSLNNPSITTTESTTPSTELTPEPKTILNDATPPPAEPAKADDSAKAAAAPEKYADYEVPEGYEIDPKVKEEADGLFRGMNLSQEQAQSLVNFFVAKTTESANRPYEAYKTMTDGWRSEAENHPDLRGKLGPGQEVNVRIAKALDSLGDTKLASDFRSLMDLTGAGNNQAFIRVINKLAERVVEGTAVSGRGPAPVNEPGRADRPSPAQAMYPHLPSNAR